MRILLLCKDMDCGGAQTHVLELASGLRLLGHEVRVASAGGALARKLRERGIGHVVLPPEKRTPAALIKLFRALRRQISEGFDIVHAHTRISAMLADGICRSKNVCFVTTVHARFRMNGFLRRACRWGSGQIAVSRDLYFYLLENAPRVSGRETRVINNGIDVRRFSPENVDRERRGDVTVLFLSRLDKDCSALAYSLCNVFVKLQASYPRAKLIIGGGGEELRALRERADEIGEKVGRRVIELVGRVEDSLDFFSRGDIFVGASRAALEAMACGLPVIIGGDEGFLGIADEKNLKRGEYSNFCCRGERAATDEALSDALSRLLNMSAEERRELGLRGCGYVREHHSAWQMAAKTEDFYKSILGRNAYRRKSEKKGGVLLCGYYGFGNMGDELMLEAAIRRAEKERKDDGKPYNIRLLSKSRAGKTLREGADRVRRSSPIAVMRAIRRADKVVFGGGTLLQNATSRRSLAYYLALLRYSQLCGKRTELWGNGIGKIRGKRSRRAVAKALSACDLVGVRDGKSMARIEEMGKEFGIEIGGVYTERDLAFEPWLYDDATARESDVLVRLGLSECKRFAVFSVMGTAERKHQKSIFEYAKKLGKEGITPIFAVMYPTQDLALSRKLCKLLGGKLAYPFGATDIVALMRQAEVVCSMRYHALVLAYISGADLIGFGDDDKIKSFCSEYGGEYIDAKNGQVKADFS